jgi:hypothetical protein
MASLLSSVIVGQRPLYLDGSLGYINLLLSLSDNAIEAHISSLSVFDNFGPILLRIILQTSPLPLNPTRPWPL